MVLHLNWDGNQNNGIIFNDKYTNGALFKGIEYKPQLSFNYDSMQMSEVFNTQDYVQLDGIKRIMTQDEANEVKAVATTWIQPLGQEGNPTLEQAQGFKKTELSGSFNIDTKAITDALPHEMTSWKDQEDEARAYVADNSVATSVLDVLVTSRGLGETVAELADKVIANADAYRAAYFPLLGKYQALTKKVDEATTVEEVEAIVW